MPRLKRNRKNLGKYGVFLVELLTGRYGVMQVVDYDESNGAYCLLFEGLLAKGECEKALEIVQTRKPVAAGGLIGALLADPEFEYVGPVRPSLHYEPAIFRIGDYSANDFSGTIHGSLGHHDEPMPDYSGVSTLGGLFDAFEEINGLPFEEMAVPPNFMRPKVPLRKYLPDSVVDDKLAALDRAAGYSSADA